jgi:hypothetical protein
MATSFIPANGSDAEDRAVENDGWYPSLSVADCRAQTGLATMFGADRVAAELLAAMIDVNASISGWRGAQTAPSLADVPAPVYGGVSEKVALYTRAVYAMARARLTNVVRDYDATAKGHDRADALEETVAVWRQSSQEALARLTGRTRTTVELI